MNNKLEASIGTCAGQPYSTYKLKATTQKGALKEIVRRFAGKMTCTGWAAVYREKSVPGKPYVILDRTERDALISLSQK